MKEKSQVADIDRSVYDIRDKEDDAYRMQEGLTPEIIDKLSKEKDDPVWMQQFRLQSLQIYNEMPVPDWGPSIEGLDMDHIATYVRPKSDMKNDWKDVPQDIKDTFERLGIPQAERKSLAGVGAQYDSELVYHNVRDEVAAQGVVYTDMESALKGEYADMVHKYFMKLVTPRDHKFAALHGAVWSGGSFVYVPKGVHVDIPLQAYFRINTPNMGQFERTLIIADEGSYVHYVEGCTAPIYSTDSLHSGVVEIFVEPHARVRYTTVQNWSNNVYNLVTQRAYVREGGTMEWVDGNIGSKATMKYPACILAEPYAKASTMSLGFAGKGQYQDTGAKMIHLAPHTSSTIVAKSISRGGGRSAYRGLVKIVKGAEGSSNSTVCDALLVDEFSRSDTYPHVDVREDNVSMAHEATVSKVSEDQLFYLMSRGLSEDEAMGMIVRGFVEPISRELPMEYALELNRLVELQMEGSVG